MPFPDDVDIDRPSPIEQLQIAFSVHIAREIVAADGILDIDEMKLLMLVFPDRLMRSCRFVGPDTELTEAFHRAHVEAVRTLPRILDTQQKLDLITLFHRTCVADGELHPKELSVLKGAARILEVDPMLLKVHLKGLHGSLTSLRG
ncbi:MAG: TerB family tellurite resistance protein [Alphaproteobacteria bacterium]|nr:TerB family tellurite resistance protein [Alphaproteobacteria bacterium]